MTTRLSMLTLLLAAAVTGCGGSAATSGPAPDPAYVVTAEPADSKGVAELLKGSKDGEAITMVGLIGGSEKPFIDGLAVFSVVDPAIPYCPKEEGCPTPWDYCCATDKLKDNKATVKVVDAQGKPVTRGAKELLGVKELSTVVVQGKAKRDADGNLTVLAEKVFVRK